MATYTFTSNATQEAILTWVTGLENAERAKKDPPLPALTNGEYLLARLADIFKGWRSKYFQVVEIDPLRAKWETLTQAQRDQIKTIAGV